MFGCYSFTRVYSSLSTENQGGRAAPIVSLVYMCLSKFSFRTKNQDIILKVSLHKQGKTFHKYRERLYLLSFVELDSFSQSYCHSF